VHTSSRTLLATLAVSALLLTGCGGNTDSGDSNTGSGAGSDTKTTATPAPAKPAAPAYRVLGKPALTKALLGIQDMPPGYSQDPPDPDRATNKTFCDYKQPFKEKFYVSRDFTKGGGLSSELLRVGLRQYANTKQAKAAFTALTDALETCTGETYEGTKLTYAPMSAAKVGDGSVGIKITADDTVLLQNYALVGPTLINTGGGGLMNANADEVTNLLKDQAKAYETAAGQ
jgi:predicted small secreted protein